MSYQDINEIVEVAKPKIEVSVKDQNAFNSPSETVEVVNHTAEAKKVMPSKKTFVLALMAGGYIAMGSLLALIVGGAMPGLAASNPGLQKFFFGAVFPLGLILCAVAGAELFTGNTAYFIPSVLSKRMSFKVPLKNWGIVYFGNFMGSLIVAYFLVYLTGALMNSPSVDSAINIAIAKTSNPFYKTFLKGIACNWMVALAMWLAYASKDIASKVLGIWFPVMAFVAMGFEHCVANMFFIPVAIFHGADISWFDFIVKNLIPATLGNIVGGALFVGTAYWYVYDKKK
ncbi:formate/nitrite transporter family protein [Marinifilum sp. N1E240]|uniref:formate/nitrite transporter family protein n=1 Tax=Marinifilum sp. N1E240 TaxID=2608082 RepID=UPI00128AEA28|nr:formate/nitrite transporter family protein [Marinifilum sp. N1E240]MPQ46868.1 formate/nitrite transporter family protein [Marinifilum sp. N1E240]